MADMTMVLNKENTLRGIMGAGKGGCNFKQVGKIKN